MRRKIIMLKHVIKKNLISGLQRSEMEIYRQQREWAYPKIEKRIGYVALSDFEPRVDSKGRKRCVNCDALIPSKNRKYCSHACANQFFREHNWGAMRSYILQRDNWTCQKCGATPARGPKGFFVGTDENPKSWWFYVADHIIPIALGGKEFDENNIQVLCGPCNKEKTKTDHAKIAKKRREITPCINPFNVNISSFYKLPITSLDRFLLV